MTRELDLTSGEEDQPDLLSNPGTDRGTTLAALGIALLLMAVYLIMSSSTMLWDRDEPRFSRAAVEMYRSGDYLVPRFNGEIRPHKPALIYWLMNAGLETFGVHEWVLRLPSAFGMAMTAFITFLIGKRMFGGRAGLRAMIIFGSAAMPIYMGTAATADGTLIAWCTAAVYPFVDRLYRGPRWWHLPAIALALAMAQMAKGPVGLAVPGFMVIATGFFCRKQVRLGGDFWGGYITAIVASIGLFLAWGVAANYASGGELAKAGLGKHVLHRMFNPMEGHGASGTLGYLAMIPVYIPVIIFGLFPWTLFVPAMFSALFGRRIGTPLDRAVIFGWALPTFIMMSLVATKLPHYILPIFPPLALAIAAMIEAHKRDELSEKDHHWLRAGLWFFVPFALVGMAAPIVGGILLGDWSLIGKAMPSTILFTVIAIIAVGAVRKAQLGRATCALAIGFPIVMVVASVLALPQLEESFKVSKKVATAIRGTLGDAASVCHAGYEEGSVFFYLNLPPELSVKSIYQLVEDGKGPAMQQWADLEGKGAMITTASELEVQKFDPAAAGLKEIFRGEVVNYSKGMRRQTVIVLARNVSVPAPAQPAPAPAPPVPEGHTPPPPAN
ncbi:MAG: glycosyltransferase family 39 protein [Phycisphaeraceae bacterium]